MCEVQIVSWDAGFTPTSSAPLYRLNHSKGLVGGTGEPRELVRCVGVISLSVGLLETSSIGPSFTFFLSFSFFSKCEGPVTLLHLLLHYFVVLNIGLCILSLDGT